jgi:RNA polymerase sigma factor (sigma-70 family)
MEKEIIQRIQQGDEKAFAKLYHLYAEYALRVAMAVTKSRANAADAVQETFIRVYDHIDRFDLTKDFKPWFYRILLNECNRLMKKQAKMVAMSDYIDDYARMANVDHHAFEQYEELYKAIENLKDIYRIPIVLKYLKGFSDEEIAQILDLNVNTVKSRLFKARNKLTKMIEKMKERGVGNG